MTNGQETILDGDMNLKKRQHEITIVEMAEDEKEEKGEIEDPFTDGWVAASFSPKIIFFEFFEFFFFLRNRPGICFTVRHSNCGSENKANQLLPGHCNRHFVCVGHQFGV